MRDGDLFASRIPARIRERLGFHGRIAQRLRDIVEALFYHAKEARMEIDDVFTVDGCTVLLRANRETAKVVVRCDGCRVSAEAFTDVYHVMVVSIRYELQLYCSDEGVRRLLEVLELVGERGEDGAEG